MSQTQAICESILTWLSITISGIRCEAVEQDLGAHMEVLLQEGTGYKVPGSTAEGGCVSRSSSLTKWWKSNHCSDLFFSVRLCIVGSILQKQMFRFWVQTQYLDYTFLIHGNAEEVNTNHLPSGVSMLYVSHVSQIYSYSFYIKCTVKLYHFWKNSLASDSEKGNELRVKTTDTGAQVCVQILSWWPTPECSLSYCMQWSSSDDTGQACPPPVVSISLLC